MATIKESFSKGLTALNVKTNNFMEENKCKTYISTLESEIADLKLRIGDVVYAKWVNGEDDRAETEPMLNSIKEKYQEIEGQKEKIKQLEEQEKQILGGATTGNEVCYCSQCGAQNAANYKFCSKCGAPLK